MIVQGIGCSTIGLYDLLLLLSPIYLTEMSSCRDNIGEGAFQCNMNGCSSLCYKINTDGCECDALRYTVSFS